MAKSVGELFVTLGLKSDLDRATKAEIRKFNTSLRQAGRGIDTLKSQALKATVVLTGMFYATYKTANSFIDAANASENYRLRLSTLLRSQSEGARMFKEMNAYAMKVPFTYREIMESATRLSGVMNGGVDEIKRWMPMIGDLAAVSGMKIDEVTQQVVRMYSAGAGSADLFRERGVLAMMGFKAGATYSVEETRKIMWDAWASIDSKFRGTTDKLANTWAGLMSMFEDKWFAFRNMVMENNVMDNLKKKAKEFLDSLTTEKLERWAKVLSENVTTALEKIGKALEFIWKHRETLATVFAVFAGTMVIQQLSATVVALGAIGNAIKVISVTPLGQWGLLLAAGIATIGTAAKLGQLVGTNIAKGHEDLTIFGGKMPASDHKTRFFNPSKNLYNNQDTSAGQIYTGARLFPTDYYQYTNPNPKPSGSGGGGGTGERARYGLEFMNSYNAIKFDAPMANAWDWHDRQVPISGKDMGYNLASDYRFDPEAFGEMGKTYQDFNNSMDEHLAKQKAMQAGWQSFGDTMSNVLANSVSQSGNAFANIANNFKRMLEVMVTEMLAKAAVFSILSMLGVGQFGKTMTMSKFVFGGFMANGGNMTSGKSYITGENGPELITMGAGQAGKVTPINNNDNSSITINISGSDVKSLNSMDLRTFADKFKEAKRNGYLTGVA